MAAIDELWELADSMRVARDRLRVQINLAGKEARDEWEELEDKWDRFRSRVKSLKEGAEEAGEDAMAAATVLGEEIREGYGRVKKRLDEEKE